MTTRYYMKDWEDKALYYDKWIEVYPNIYVKVTYKLTGHEFKMVQ